MKQPLEDHAERFDQKAPDYDTEKPDEYKAAVSLVIDHAQPQSDDVVLDLGTGTGAIALALAADAKEVIGRDISEGMLDEAQQKATERDIDNVEFGTGRFRDPDAPDTVDIVTSNYALHHLDDDQKREAVALIADLEPKRFVLGDIMFLEGLNTDLYAEDVDDPATVGVLAEAFTDAGFAVTAVEPVAEHVAVLVGERIEE
jgi:SAM-dependent methyltransferase